MSVLSHRADELQRVPLGVAQQDRPNARLDQATVCVDEALVHGKRTGIAAQGRIHLRQTGGEVFRMGEVGNVQADHGLASMPQQSGKARVDLDEVALQIDPGQPDVERAKDLVIRLGIIDGRLILESRHGQECGLANWADTASVCRLLGLCAGFPHLRGWLVVDHGAIASVGLGAVERLIGPVNAGAQVFDVEVACQAG